MKQELTKAEIERLKEEYGEEMTRQIVEQIETNAPPWVYAGEHGWVEARNVLFTTERDNDPNKTITFCIPHLPNIKYNSKLIYSNERPTYEPKE